MPLEQEAQPEGFRRYRLQGEDMTELTDIFDTHAHYDDKAFDDDREVLLAGLPGHGITRVVNVGASRTSLSSSKALSS